VRKKESEPFLKYNENIKGSDRIFRWFAGPTPFVSNPEQTTVSLELVKVVVHGLAGLRNCR